MTRWTVKLEGVQEGAQDDVNLNFSDTGDVMEIPIIERYVIQDISDAARKNDHYHELPNVKTVDSDKGDSIPKERATLILVTPKGKGGTAELLLYLNEDLKYEVRGLDPVNFFEDCCKEKNKILELLTQLSSDPKAFEDVNLVLPEDRF